MKMTSKSNLSALIYLLIYLHLHRNMNVFGQKYLDYWMLGCIHVCVISLLAGSKIKGLQVISCMAFTVGTCWY